MRVLHLTHDNQNEVIQEATATLQSSGSIVYPTDTVYGLGVNPFDDFAVRRLFRTKERPPDKPVPLIVKSIAMAKKLAYIDYRKEKILRSVWPGAVSVVLAKRRIVSSFIAADTQTVALRIPDNEFCLKLIRAFNGPLTSTSANISGESHTNDPQRIIARFDREPYKPDLVIDAGVLGVKEPSTVLDLTGGKAKITRVGPVTPKELSSLLKL